MKLLMEHGIIIQLANYLLKWLFAAALLTIHYYTTLTTTF